MAACGRGLETTGTIGLLSRAAAVGTLELVEAVTALRPTMRIGCHSWRARHHGPLGERGLLEHAQRMAGHASARTMKLYDRRGEQVSLDEVERIVF